MRDAFSKVIGRVASLALFLALAGSGLGCANGNAQAVVTQPLDGDARVRSLKIEEDVRGATVPDVDRQAFRNMLTVRLLESGAFATGDDLTLRYSFMEYEPGSRAGRLLFGVTNAGSEANMMVKCDYLNKQGKHLSTVQVSSRLTGGLLALGGTAQDALKQAADKTRDYTVSHFAVQH